MGNFASQSGNDVLHFTRFKPENQDPVKNLILSGLAEHFGTIDVTRNPDLNQIADTYADHDFLLAWCGERIVGTGALLRRSENTAEIVRMSVAYDMRRQGIGRQILAQILDFARVKGYRQVILETTDTWEEVIQFYLRCGFHITHYQEGDVYFALDLPSES
jgi:putative acetyltransferase